MSCIDEVTYSHENGKTEVGESHWAFTCNTIKLFLHFKKRKIIVNGVQRVTINGFF